jgi:carbonic anhydrase
MKSDDDGKAPADLTGEESLRRLKEGNERFVVGTARWTGMAPAKLAKLTTGQKPFATILGCSDSRVPPELIFDAVLGELFVIRVAGNVFSAEIAGSLQYAGAHLRTPLFVVLGHTGCGAVAAALSYRSQRARQGSRIQVLIDAIAPAMDEVSDRLQGDRLLEAAVEANVRWTMRQILTAADERALHGTSRFKLIGGIYQISTGRVRFLEDSAR